MTDSKRTSVMGRIQPVVTVRYFSKSATYYAAANGRIRPGAVVYRKCPDEMSFRYAKILCCLTMLSVTAASTSNAATSRIEAEVQSRGAASVLKAYFDSPSWEKTILDPIKTASPSGLRIAELLYPVADAGASEDLGEALYEGLAVAPQKVLPVIMRLYRTSAEEACTVSFEASLPKGGVDAYLRKIERNLSSSVSSDQATMSAQCRLGLEHSKEIAKQHGLLAP